MTRVWVIERAFEHEGSDVIGVCGSRESAMALVCSFIAEYAQGRHRYAQYTPHEDDNSFWAEGEWGDSIGACCYEVTP